MFLSGHFHDNYQTQPVRGEVVVFQNFVFGVVLRTLCTFAQVFFELFKVLEVWNCSTVWKFEKNTFGITKQCFLELKSFWVQVNVGELSFIPIKKSFRSHKSQSLPIFRHFEVISLQTFEFMSNYRISWILIKPRHIKRKSFFIMAESFLFESWFDLLEHKTKCLDVYVDPQIA